MPTPPTAQERNRELARTINEEVRRNHQSPYAGKYLGIVDGQVVAVTDSLDELVRRLGQAGASPDETLCLEAGLDYDAVQEIWGTP
jgi:hypothetical protein